MVRLGLVPTVPARAYDPWGCPQATAPLTVPTPLSNITLDTGPPPFNMLPYEVSLPQKNEQSINLRATIHQISDDDAEGNKRQNRLCKFDQPIGSRQRNPQRRDRAASQQRNPFICPRNIVAREERHKLGGKGDAEENSSIQHRTDDAGR